MKSAIITINKNEDIKNARSIFCRCMQQQQHQKQEKVNKLVEKINTICFVIKYIYKYYKQKQK